MPKSSTKRAAATKVLPFKPRPVPRRFQIVIDEVCGDDYAAFGLYGGDKVNVEEGTDLKPGELFAFTCACQGDDWWMAGRFDEMVGRALLHTTADGNQWETDASHFGQLVRLVSIVAGEVIEVEGVH